jgi:hypothetical protein
VGTNSTGALLAFVLVLQRRIVGLSVAQTWLDFRDFRSAHYASTHGFDGGPDRGMRTESANGQQGMTDCRTFQVAG